MRKDYVIGVAITALIGFALLGGCGGHSGHVPPGNGGGGTQTTFVGKDVCIPCHSGPGNAYAGSAHGQDFYTAHGQDLIDGFGGACAPCHVTGYGEPGGWRSTAQTPHLSGISCEECHTAGSDHAGSPSASNIQALPVATTTCWDCHVPEYKLLRSPVATVTDADLQGTVPSRVHVYHGQAAFLNGYLGFNRPQSLPAHALIENTCVTCHLNEASGRHHGATGPEVDYLACTPCHGSEANAEALVANIAAETDTALIEIGGEDPSNPGHPDESGSGGLLGAFVAAHGIDINSNANADDAFVKRYKAARHNYSYIISSGAGGAHNAGFTRGLLQDTRDFLQ